MIEAVLPPSSDGSVILDIGGVIGALVLHTPSTMEGHEIELILQDSTKLRTHSAVRERHQSSGISYAAVYPSLATGTYLIEGSSQMVNIVGGQVTEVSFSDQPDCPPGEYGAHEHG